MPRLMPSALASGVRAATQPSLLVRIGKVNNQNFVYVPFNRLIHMICYKAEEYGIKVIVREESYTSRLSALDFDPLPNFGDKNANQALSSGKRIRGLFIRSNGQIINADVNGCLNIGRKELGDDWLKKLIETDEGCLMQPVTVLLVVTRMGVTTPRIPFQSKIGRGASSFHALLSKVRLSFKRPAFVTNSGRSSFDGLMDNAGRFFLFAEPVSSYCSSQIQMSELKRRNSVSSSMCRACVLTDLTSSPVRRFM